MFDNWNGPGAQNQDQVCAVRIAKLVIESCPVAKKKTQDPWIVTLLRLVHCLTKKCKSQVQAVVAAGVMLPLLEADKHGHHMGSSHRDLADNFVREIMQQLENISDTNEDSNSASLRITSMFLKLTPTNSHAFAQLAREDGSWTVLDTLIKLCQRGHDVRHAWWRKVRGCVFPATSDRSLVQDQAYPTEQTDRVAGHAAVILVHLLQSGAMAGPSKAMARRRRVLDELVKLRASANVSVRAALYRLQTFMVRSKSGPALSMFDYAMQHRGHLERVLPLGLQPLGHISQKALSEMHLQGGALIAFRFEVGWCVGCIEKKYYPLGNKRGYTHWVEYEDSEKVPHELSMTNYNGASRSTRRASTGAVGNWVMLETGLGDSYCGAGELEEVDGGLGMLIGC